MRYLIIERFNDADPLPVYRRARTEGRMLPAGLSYLDSWVDEDLSRCFQLMECTDRKLLVQWMERWRDLVDFEVVPVLSTEQVLERLAERL